MITTQTQNVKTFCEMPSVNPTAFHQQIDAETKHKIYDRLLTLLSNPKVKAKKTGLVLPYILHPLTKQSLMSEHGYTAQEIAELEGQIIQDADENLTGYEVLRDAPAALYHALEQNSDWIFDNRVASLPTPAQNALVCEALQKEFARKVLLACDGFVEHRGTDESGIIHKAIRLDIDGWITHRGFMVPIYRYGLITALKVFRHPHDERPFRLNSRTKGETKW